MRAVVGTPDTKWINPDGTPTPVFFEMIQALVKNSLTMPVSVTTPTNGQKLQYNSTTKQWEPA